MKTFRVWLLLLLAVLLPLRGALAAGMLCPIAESGVQLETVIAAHDPVHEHMGHDHPAHADVAHADHDHGGSHHHDGALDKCNLCSAFCSVPALLHSAPSLAMAPPADAAFPHLPAPSATFIAEGPERPPRSI